MQDKKKEKKKWEPPPPPPRVGKKARRRGASALGAKLPTVTPTARCKLRALKLERVKDWLLIEEEFVANQERLRPQEERNEEDRSKVDDLRGSPLSVGSLEELVDENHAIVSTSVGPEYYVGAFDCCLGVV
jgi:26S proteasome regulatory subunit T2